jgi:TPR repeat protein
VLNGPPEAAVCWLREAAERGSPEAQTALGQHLLEGVGVSRDETQSVFWFRRAAKADYPTAFNMLGRCYEQGRGVAPDMVIAVHWYHLAAAAGLDWGMYNYATALMLGNGVAHDRKNAFDWFRRAASLAHAKSLNIVGGFYEDGWEVSRDMSVAIRFYEQAAEGGDFRGQFNLARWLATTGRVEEAVAWMQRSLQGATPAFAHKVRSFLEESIHPSLREVASRVSAARRCRGETC